MKKLYIYIMMAIFGLAFGGEMKAQYWNGDCINVKCPEAEWHQETFEWASQFFPSCMIRVNCKIMDEECDGEQIYQAVLLSFEVIPWDCDCWTSTAQIYRDVHLALLWRLGIEALQDTAYTPHYDYIYSPKCWEDSDAINAYKIANPNNPLDSIWHEDTIHRYRPCYQDTTICCMDKYRITIQGHYITGAEYISSTSNEEEECIEPCYDVCGVHIDGIFSIPRKLEGIVPLQKEAIKNVNYNSSDNSEKPFIKPNPVSDRLEIIFSSNEKSIISLKVYDAIGNAVFFINENVNIGNNTFSINVSDYPEGIYHFKIFDGETSVGNSFIVKR